MPELGAARVPDLSPEDALKAPHEGAASQETTPVRCASCDMTSPVAEAFTKRRRSFRLKYDFECPVCTANRQQKAARRELLWIGLTLLLGLLALGADLAAGILLLNIVLVQCLLVIMIGPHELGHLLGARAVGLSAPAVIMGTGRRLTTFQALGARWDWRIMPYGGATVIGDRGLAHYRWRYWLAVLAGPSVNAAALLALWGLGVRWDDMVTLSSGPELLADLAWANLLILVFNLLPMRRLNVFGQKQGTDGWLLLTVPFMSTSKLDEQKAAGFAAEAYFLVLDERIEEAHEVARLGLEGHPDNFHILNVLAIAELNLGKYHEARSTFTRLREREKDPKLRALMASNLAWANTLIGGSELIEAADRLSAEAVEILPWVPAIRSTRGLVLACVGRPDEALPLLQNAMAQEQEASTRVTMMMSMAYAYTLLGKTADAQALLASVEKVGEPSFEVQSLHAKILDARSSASMATPA